MQKQLDELTEVHLALLALLESRIISQATKRRLRILRAEIEREIKLLEGQSETMAAD